MTMGHLATTNDIEELLSETLVMSVAAAAGFVTSKPHLDRDSIDLYIHGGGSMRPTIGVQLKASINLEAKGGVIKFPLPVKNYNDLREKTQWPRMLVLMRLPANQNEWLVADKHSLVMKHCAYWVSLEGACATANKTKVTVEVPETNVLTIDELSTLMDRARKGSLK
ncbi:MULTISPECIES: DUF4365 domain-containing protein [unclassified Sphingomonas]|uniref:DUF4365 domain-containing protein n=1 Tax=Sphingomonas sp. PvP015 TaxID=3156388 RepID=UPI00339632FB